MLSKLRIFFAWRYKEQTKVRKINWFPSPFLWVSYQDRYFKKGLLYLIDFPHLCLFLWRNFDLNVFEYSPRGYIEGGYYFFISAAGIIRVRVLFEGGSYTRKYCSSNSSSFMFWSSKQRYTYRVLQTIQMKFILLWVWAGRAVSGRAKTALKFKYKIWIGQHIYHSMYGAGHKLEK